jgi:hypothetical protein
MIQEHASGVVRFRVPRINKEFVAFRRKICALQTAIIYGRLAQTDTHFVLICLSDKNYATKCETIFKLSPHSKKDALFGDASVRPFACDPAATTKLLWNFHEIRYGNSL